MPLVPETLIIYTVSNIFVVTDLLTIMSDEEFCDDATPGSTGGKKKTESSSSSEQLNLMNVLLAKMDHVSTELASMRRTAATTNASIAATNASVADANYELANVQQSIKQSVESALNNADFASRLHAVEGRLTDDSTNDGKGKEAFSVAQILEALKDKTGFDFIKMPESSSPEEGGRDPQAYIEVDLKVADTWLEHPAAEKDSGDSIGIFGPHQKWPAVDRFFTPKGGKNEPDKSITSPIPFKINDSDYDDFLTSHSLSVNNKVSLAPYIFQDKDISIEKSSDCHVVDALSRQAAGIVAASKQMITGSRGRLDKIIGNWDKFLDLDDMEIDEKFGDTFSKEKMFAEVSLMRDSLRVAVKGLNRNYELCLAIFASNKRTWRKSVLNRCYGSEVSKEKMERSRLATPSLFGPAPESFKKQVITATSAGNHSSFVLKVKSGHHNNPSGSTPNTSNRGRGRKRAAPPYANQDKRLKPYTDKPQPFQSPQQTHFQNKTGRGGNQRGGFPRRGKWRRNN